MTRFNGLEKLTWYAIGILGMRGITYYLQILTYILAANNKRLKIV